MVDFQIASQHHIKWDPGGRTVSPPDPPGRAILFVLTGVAVGNWYGTGQGWASTQAHFDVPFPDGYAYRYLHWAPFVALASIGSDGPQDSSGWAVDGFGILRTDQSTRFVYVEVDVGARNGVGGIWRLAYNIQVLVYRG